MNSRADMASEAHLGRRDPPRCAAKSDRGDLERMKQTFEQIVNRMMDGGSSSKKRWRSGTDPPRAGAGAHRRQSIGGQQVLGIHRNTLQRKLLEYKLERKPPQKVKGAARRAAAGSLTQRIINRMNLLIFDLDGTLTTPNSTWLPRSTRLGRTPE